MANSFQNMKIVTASSLVFFLFNLVAPAEDIANLAVPWPPAQKVTDSPFAQMSCNSYASYNQNGQRINPKWGDENPTDFGSREVQFDFSGIRELNQVGGPGVHPRIFCTPADLTDIRHRLKETRCGQEAWKTLLCFTNMMKGTFDSKADYAQGPTMIRNNNILCRVPASRCGYRDNATAAALYQALVKGDKTANPGLLWAVFPLEAFRCWIEDDKPAAQDLASAVTTALKFDQARRNATRKDKDAPLEQPIAGIHLAYTYDFLYDSLSSEQRKLIHDELANGTWSHDNYGTFNTANNSRSNWATFSYWLIEVLAIEGEPGFNDLKVRGIYRGWRNLLTYGWFKSGATYEGEAKNQLGMDGVLALAIRAKAYGFDNLAGHPFLRAYATDFLPKSANPMRDGFIKYDLLGGCHSSLAGGSDLIGLKYLFPDDKKIDWSFRNAVGENYENVPNRCEAGTYDTTIWGGYLDPLIPFLIFASDYDPANTDPSKFGLSNTFFCGERALMMTRSSWDKDALMLNLHVRQANGGHPFADRNSIMVAGAGRIWSPIYGWGYDGLQNFNNSEVVIDDHPQSERTPGRMVDFSDQPQATFAVGDAKYAWDWNWKYNDTWGAKGTYTLDDYNNKTIKIDSANGWEFEPHSVNDFSYLKQPLDYLNQPLAIQPSWLLPAGCIRPIVRQPNYSVQTAFRTAGLIRGAHPYALVIDDIQKDDQPHDYTWYMTLEYDVQIAEIDKPNDHEMDIILTGSDPTQAKAVEAGVNDSKAPLAPKLEDISKVPAGQPMLLVRFLNYNNTDPTKIATEAKEPTIMEDTPPPDPKGHYLQRVRRLAVPVHALSPDFKVLLYAYHQGDPLPTTAWSGNKTVTVSWPDQQDQIMFSMADSGKTNLTVTRGSSTLITMANPIAKLEATP